MQALVLFQECSHVMPDLEAGTDDLGKKARQATGVKCM